MTQPISKSEMRFVQSLKNSDARSQEQCFVAEGNKMVQDIMHQTNIRTIISTQEWLDKNNIDDPKTTIRIAKQSEIDRISHLKSPQQVIAIIEMPTYTLDDHIAQQQLCLALDGIQDPGNVGTIIRLADWFGIEHIVCSKNCSNLYNPKTIQSTMGAFVRVKTHYVDLPQWLALQHDTPIYGTFLDGDNIYQQPLTEHGILIMGSEGKGISPEVASMIDHKLYIPNYPCNTTCAESLNVALATSIACAEFRRRITQ